MVIDTPGLSLPRRKYTRHCAVIKLLTQIEPMRQMIPRADMVHQFRKGRIGRIVNTAWHSLDGFSMSRMKRYASRLLA
jgi:hypothetical protein